MTENQTSPTEKQIKYPAPKNETVLAVFPKKDERKQLHLLFHQHESLAYLVFSFFVMKNGQNILQRWCALGASEIDGFVAAAMNGFEMSNTSTSNNAPLIECPFLLFSCERKNGTREVRLTLEKCEESHYLKLATFQCKDEQWTRRDNEWAAISFRNLNELISEVKKGKKMIEDFYKKHENSIEF